MRDWWFVDGGAGVCVGSVSGVAERARSIMRVLARSVEKGVIKVGIWV